MNWANKINGKNKIFQLNPIPLHIKNKHITRHDIKKLIIPLKFTEIGNISRGKYTFFKIPPLTKIVFVPCPTTVVK